MRRAELARAVFEAGGGAPLAHRVAGRLSCVTTAEYLGSAVGVLLAVGRDAAAMEAARLAARAALAGPLAGWAAEHEVDTTRARARWGLV